MPLSCPPFSIAMTAAYDLVVIGDSSAGIFAAVAASRLRARVALVQQHPSGTETLEANLYQQQTLTQIAERIRQLQQAQIWGLPALELSVQPRFQADIQQWAQATAATLSELTVPATLASFGIDVVQDRGYFSSRPSLTLIGRDRPLRSRAYLIATGTRPTVPSIDGLAAIGYLTPGTLLQGIGRQTYPEQLVIIGSDPAGVELAQALARLGCRVTLIVRSARLLPAEDAEAAFFVQAQLEADGIRVLTDQPVTKVEPFENQKRLWVGSEAIATDEILVTAGGQPNLSALNLEAVGVHVSGGRLQLNAKLQTTNPRIYACGDLRGGYSFPHIAQYEASTALKNALFLPLFRVEYRALPWVIGSDPPLARVGLTEAQARKRFGSEVKVLRQSFKQLASARLAGEMTGLCKLIVRRNGILLGAHIVGPNAPELILPLALAIRQHISIGAIARLVPAALTYSEVITQTAAQWQQRHLQQQTWLQESLESFFHWRRSLSP